MADGKEVTVEVNASLAGTGEDTGVIPASRADEHRTPLVKAKETFEVAFGKVVPALKYITSTLKELSPDEFEVQLGITFNAKSGAVIAEVASTANLNVTLRWKNEMHTKDQENKS
jgi:hypothetical protein